VARPKPWHVDDELWAVIEPLLPKVERRVRHPGRKRHPDRLVFQGILFVLHTGISWEHLPQELGFGSGMTCWRRLAEWTDAGVWPRLHEVLLAKLRSVNALDCTIPDKADQARNRKNHGYRGGRPPKFCPEDYKARHAVESGIITSKGLGPCPRGTTNSRSPTRQRFSSPLSTSECDQLHHDADRVTVDADRVCQSTSHELALLPT
jgi:transposase